MLHLAWVFAVSTVTQCLNADQHQGSKGISKPCIFHTANVGGQQSDFQEGRTRETLRKTCAE